MNAPAADLDEEQRVEPSQLDRVPGEEVDCQDLVDVRANELAPGALAAPERRPQPMAAEHLANRSLHDPQVFTQLPVLPTQLRQLPLLAALKPGTLPRSISA